ncbi:MAG TPA: L,D-transpeptidase [Ramlibacter sp.]|nr:L,D-transpeptidase [Ramlibacter sp.]
MQWKSSLAVLCAAWTLAAAAVAAPLDPAFERQRPSADARAMAEWTLRNGDARGKPFVIVDKKAARLYAFNAQAQLVGATPVILGSTPGDHTVPGVGDRAQTGTLAANERTTPAGRFETHPGRNRDGEHVIWLDYEAAFAIHRLRPGRTQQVRAARLESSSPKERRLSLGCVVVPVQFYLDVVEPLLGRKRGVVYVLPERRPLGQLITEL